MGRVIASGQRAVMMWQTQLMANRADLGAQVRTAVMLVMWGVIATVSTYDCYLTVKYHKSLKEMENNPVGRWIMDLDRGVDVQAEGLALFLGLKVAGTLIVVFSLQAIERLWRRWSVTITSAIASLQMMLGVWLTVA